jgi:hypothetical protein
LLISAIRMVNRRSIFVKRTHRSTVFNLCIAVLVLSSVDGGARAATPQNNPAAQGSALDTALASQSHLTDSSMVPPADPTSVPGDTAEGVFGEGSQDVTQPGSMGAMTWTYPFSLPAARGRPQPSLILNYNSSSHDREAGYGWGLDLPVIERKPLSGNPCFTLAGMPVACGEQRIDLSSRTVVSEERYTYSGQPLVFICQLPGSQASCGDELQPEWTTNGKYGK